MLAERGYLIPAIDNDTTDYLACAVQLARSIREFHPDAQIAAITACNKMSLDKDTFKSFMEILAKAISLRFCKHN